MVVKIFSELPLDRGGYIFGITDKKYYKPNDKFYAKLFLIAKDSITKGKYRMVSGFKFGDCYSGNYEIVQVINDTAYIEGRIPDTVTTERFKFCGVIKLKLPNRDTTFTLISNLLLEK